MRQIVLIFLVCTFALSGCAGLKSNQTVVAQDYYISVSLEAFRSLPKNLKMSQPYSLDYSTLKEVMQNIHYRGAKTITGRHAKMPVFQDDEIERLAPSLIEAVSLTTNDQYVRFVSFNQGKGVLFNTSRKTEGILFISSAGKLNIAFNFINDKRSASETSAMFHEFSPLNPLELATIESQIVVTAPGLTMYISADGTQSPAWVVGDLGFIKKRLSTQTASVTIPTPSQPQTNELPGVSPTKTTDKLPVAQPQEKQKMEKIKSKLVFLKNLFEEGLISPKEYQKRKRIVLDKLE